MRTSLWLATAVAALSSPVVAAPVDVCFVPAERCDVRIADEIATARSSIRLQAYGFNSKVILPALVAAKERGVDIAVILDRSDERGSHIGIAAMQAVGVPVWIDTPPGIAHMKAIVIDQRKVIAGSFNFTNSAQRRNVEDVLFVDDPRLAARFLENWGERQAVSRAPLPDAFAGR